VLRHAVARTPSAALSIHLEGAGCILSACTAPMTMVAVAATRRHERADAGPALLSRSGCRYRWHALMNRGHSDSTTSRFDSPARRHGRGGAGRSPAEVHSV
jgi:hypothetical protein